MALEDGLGQSPETNRMSVDRVYLRNTNFGGLQSERR